MVRERWLDVIMPQVTKLVHLDEFQDNPQKKKICCFDLECKHTVVEEVGSSSHFGSSML